MALGNKRTDRSAWILGFIILDRQDIFKKNSMSLGVVVLEKLFTRTRTRMSQSDAIMSEKSVDIKTGILREKVIKCLP